MATADKILLRLTKVEDKISTVVDLTDQFNANNSVYQEFSKWDAAVVEIVNPSDSILFKTTNDNGSVTGQLLPVPEVPINWIDVMGVDNYKNNVTSVNYSSLVKFVNIGKYLQFQGYVPPPPAGQIQVAASENLDITGDFTIEFFMNFANTDGFPRAYSIGSYPNAKNAVSIEGSGSVLYFWANNSPLVSGEISGVIGSWKHVAIVGDGSIVSLYFDGTKIGTASYGGSISSTGLPMYLGSENQPNTNLNGYLSNFRINTTAVYSGDTLTVPTAPLASIFGTTLLTLQGNSLVLETTDNSGMGNIITSDNANYSILNPFVGYQGSVQLGNV